MVNGFVVVVIVITGAVIVVCMKVTKADLKCSEIFATGTVFFEISILVQT